MARAYGWTADADPDRCRVCGWDLGEPGWDPSPNYLICTLCGAESGPDDDSETKAARYLAWWIGSGAVWNEPSERPEGWSVSSHLATIGVVVRRKDLR